MAQVLDNILAYKRKEVDAAKAAVSEATLRANAEAQIPPGERAQNVRDVRKHVETYEPHRRRREDRRTERVA